MLIKPLFWDLKKANIYSIVLFPFSLIIIFKNYIISLIKKKNYKIKSICVGNIYLGGTGKTPLVLKLYELLKKKNTHIATAKKIYKRHLDEELILKEKTNLITKKNRIKIFNEAVKKKIDYLIFDDGLQDISVDYDLKFVCFKSKNFIGNGHIIPAGPLREKISSLSKYDAVFLNGTENILNCIKIIKKINPKIPIFKTNYIIKNGKHLDKKKKYIIFSGIGDYKSFEDFLIKNKFNLISHKIFPDHHNYTKNDMLKILKISKINNAKILTTEKDYIKISNLYKNKIFCIKIDLKIENQEKLKKLIKKKFNEKN